MKVIAIANQKGGVGKTSTTLNIGAALADMGNRVLIVDMDPSGDLTNHAGIDLQDGDNTVYEVLTDGVPVESAIRHVERESTGIKYDVLPADSALAELAETLHGQDDKQSRLRTALHDGALSYDYVIIDTPPSIGLQIVNGLVAADTVIVPAQPHYLSLSAVNAVAGTVQDIVEAGLNDSLAIGGVVLTNYNNRAVHHRNVREAIVEALPDTVFDTTISNGIAVTEAAANGTDLFEYSAVTPIRRKSKSLEQYRDLANEIVERLNGKG